MLTSSFTSTPAPYVDEAKSLRSVGDDCQPPAENAAHKQKSWDSPRTASAAQHLLNDATNDEEQARLLAVSTKESGVWLRALPVSSLGLRIDDNTVRIAVALRLGISVCGPHQCQHCSAMVDEFG